RARHPRHKTCAGGVIPRAEATLAALGVDLDVPSARVDRAAVCIPGRALAIPGDRLCRVVRRHEFDARLAWAARDRGGELCEDAHVVRIVREGERVRVETPARVYRAEVVVGADGSGSLVRRALIGGAAPIGRALMCDVPIDQTTWDGFAARRYDFDFS